MMTHRNSRARNIFISSEPPESLTESEELLSAFFKSSNIGVAILDSDLRYLAVSRVLAEISGIPPQNHPGKTVREILGDVGDLVEHQFAQVVKTRHGLKFEVCGKIPSREPIGHWIIDTFPISTLQDSAIRIGLIVYEIMAPTVLESSVRQLDEKLRQETKRLQMLTDVISLLSSNWDVARLFPKMSARLRRVLCQEFAQPRQLFDSGTPDKLEAPKDRRRRDLKSEEFAKPLGLGAADRNLGLLLVVHPQLVRALEPRDDFPNTINVDQVRTVGTPEQIRVETVQELFQRPAVGLSFHACCTRSHDCDHAVFNPRIANVFLVDKKHSARGFEKDL